MLIFLFFSLKREQSDILNYFNKRKNDSNSGVKGQARCLEQNLGHLIIVLLLLKWWSLWPKFVAKTLILFYELSPSQKPRDRLEECGKEKNYSVNPTAGGQKLIKLNYGQEQTKRSKHKLKLNHNWNPNITLDVKVQNKSKSSLYQKNLRVSRLSPNS